MSTEILDNTKWRDMAGLRKRSSGEEHTEHEQHGLTEVSSGLPVGGDYQAAFVAMAVSSSKTSANRMAKIKAIFSCMPKPHPLRQAVNFCWKSVHLETGIVHLALQDHKTLKVCALLGRCNSGLELSRDTAIFLMFLYNQLHDHICVCLLVCQCPSLGRQDEQYAVSCAITWSAKCSLEPIS